MYTLRWSLEELVAGVKMLPGSPSPSMPQESLTITLAEALMSNSVVKIDVFAHFLDDLGYMKVRITNA